jgi:hypothetical protein
LRLRQLLPRALCRLLLRPRLLSLLDPLRLLSGLRALLLLRLHLLLFVCLWLLQLSLRTLLL